MYKWDNCLEVEVLAVAVPAAIAVVVAVAAIRVVVVAAIVIAMVVVATMRTGDLLQLVLVQLHHFFIVLDQLLVLFACSKHDWFPFLLSQENLSKEAPEIV